jgi:biotin carboxyl carrier protein
MDLSELERLVQIVQSAEIREITIRQGDSRITVRKDLNPPATGTALVVQEDEWDSSDSLVVENGGNGFVEGDAPAAAGTTIVTAPSVGVFHHMKPHVGLAAMVREGQVIGQIEAIRLMNDVIAHASGQVVDVLVEDGMAVEYGQHLFAIDVSTSV